LKLNFLKYLKSFFLKKKYRKKKKPPKKKKKTPKEIKKKNYIYKKINPPKNKHPKGRSVNPQIMLGSGSTTIIDYFLGYVFLSFYV
jgi:hypothetical protein